MSTNSTSHTTPSHKRKACTTVPVDANARKFRRTELCSSTSECVVSSSSSSSRCNAEDRDYFDAYSFIDIHEEMLQDTTRTNAYRKAIMDNRELFQDKVVLDVGCGTAILSMFAADAGAARVYAIDASEMVDFARTIVADNNLSHVITVIQSKMEDVKLPEKVDIIISEWMGYFLLYESMLPSVLHARDEWLKPGGAMFPSSAQLYVTPFSWPELIEERTGMWHSLYGKNMSALVPLATKSLLAEPLVDHLTSDLDIALAPSKALDLDLYTTTVDDIQSWQSEFSFQSTICAELHGICAWFDVQFPGGSVLSTSPDHSETHWGQVMLWFDHFHQVQQDDRLRGTLDFSINPQYRRSVDLNVKLTLEPCLTERQSVCESKLFTIR
jgi:2-polyprenyl-3-methyl-5-hydroxy-6-metoxy-1,4-benzoquinol methylase